MNEEPGLGQTSWTLQSGRFLATPCVPGNRPGTLGSKMSSSFSCVYGFVLWGPGVLEKDHSQIHKWFPSLLHEAPSAGPNKLCAWGRIMAPSPRSFCSCPAQNSEDATTMQRQRGKGEGASLAHSGARGASGACISGTVEPGLVNL